MSESATANDATIAMYNAIPDVLSNHFSNFRSLPGIHPAAEDMRMTHGFAGGAPLSESSVIEIGCGDGRDAVDFVPLAGIYTGYGPAEGELELARKRFPGARPDMFKAGYAQTTDYPEDTDIMMSVNTILHVPQRDLTAVFERVASGLRQGGAFHLITKVEDTYSEEQYPDNFPGTEQMSGRTFYHHSPDTLARRAAQAGLVPVHHERTLVSTKPWDWFALIVQKPAA